MCNYGMDSTIIEVVLPFAGEGGGSESRFPWDVETYVEQYNYKSHFVSVADFLT